jgi:hypothetical protein
MTAHVWVAVVISCAAFGMALAALSLALAAIR